MGKLLLGVLAGWVLYSIATGDSDDTATPAPTEPVANVDVTGGSSYTGFILED